MPSHRAFIALPVSGEAAASISAVQSSLRQPGCSVRWESPEKFHITLKFLGTADKDLLDRPNSGVHSPYDSPIYAGLFLHRSLSLK
jgi:2'-5' RNA ligase